MGIEQIKTGSISKLDIFAGRMILGVIALVLLTLNSVNPSNFTAVYVPVFILSFIFFILAVFASTDRGAKILPFAAYGFGDLKKNFIVLVGVGLIFGAILVSGTLSSKSILEVSVPKLGVSDPAQNVFLAAFIVPFIEEGTTAMTVLPSIANVIAQGGLGFMLATVGVLSFFWFSGYNFISFIILLSLAYILRNNKTNNLYLIAIIAILIDAAFFTVLNTHVYPLDTAADKLMRVFMYRLVGDTLVVYFASIVPVILAHSINNAVAVSYVNGIWVVSPVIAIMPVVAIIALFYFANDIKKIVPF